MGRGRVFQNGKGSAGKNPGKAGNSGDMPYFILKSAGLRSSFPRSQVAHGNEN